MLRRSLRAAPPSVPSRSGYRRHDGTAGRRTHAARVPARPGRSRPWWPWSWPRSWSWSWLLRSAEQQHLPEAAALRERRGGDEARAGPPGDRRPQLRPELPGLARRRHQGLRPQRRVRREQAPAGRLEGHPRPGRRDVLLPGHAAPAHPGAAARHRDGHLHRRRVRGGPGSRHPGRRQPHRRPREHQRLPDRRLHRPGLRWHRRHRAHPARQLRFRQQGAERRGQRRRGRGDLQPGQRTGPHGAHRRHRGQPGPGHPGVDPQRTGPSTLTIPVVGASFADGESLAQSGSTASIEVLEPEIREDFNVLAEKPGQEA